MVRVEVRLKERSEWVQIFDPRDATVFVAGDDPPEIGQDVRIDLFAGSPGPRIILRGQIISRHTSPPGFSAALGVEERAKTNWLNAFVRGGMIDLREKRRLPIRLEVAYEDGGRRTAHTRDINEEGIFVITETPMAEERPVELELSIPGGEPLSLSGTVSHTVVVEDLDVPGMGIRFDQPASDELVAVIDKLERQLIAGELPEDCLH